MLPFKTKVLYNVAKTRHPRIDFFLHMGFVFCYISKPGKFVQMFSVHIEFTRMIVCNKKCEALPEMLTSEETTAN